MRTDHLVTNVAASAAVIDVGGKICATAAAAGSPRATADVGPASTAHAARGVIAGSAGGKALTSRRPFGTSVAEGLARVLRGLAGRPGSPRRERAQHGPGEDGAQTAQRFAAGYRFGERLRKFVEQMVHDRSFRCVVSETRL